ncbi:DNA-binding response regulator [Sphingobacteriales bacterium UPWRP_1]|nr:DNA-binding response regulator [Sphingobacteriales bacterium TSM_CSS]PSJ74933.1 DNA-binding response regulator [Sphingobacteriales bacterium UPWRP_1]
MTLKNPKLLLVEDDPNLGDILREYLSMKGYDTTLCENGAEGFNSFAKNRFDMCILDVMMPVMDGFTLAKKIREKNEFVPIIFLTAKSMKEDKVEGFKVGGDDYLTKPFSMEELKLRIDAIWRRCQQQANAPTTVPDEFAIGSYIFKPTQQTLEQNGETIKLTTKESALLVMLCQNKNSITEREITLKTIWGEDNYFTARSMDVFITKLRKYLKEDPNINIINVHGKGYKLIDMP